MASNFQENGIFEEQDDEGGMRTQELENVLNYFSAFNSSASGTKIRQVRILGVFPSDLIPFSHFLSSSRESSLCCIANTDPSTKPGTHWVAFYRDLQNDSPLEFFDSYGQSPLSYGFFSGNSKFPKDLPLSFNNTILQSLTSNVCGQYCLLFLYLRMKSECPSPLHFIINKMVKLAPNSQLRDKCVANLISALIRSQTTHSRKSSKRQFSTKILVPFDTSEFPSSYLMPSSCSQCSHRSSFLFSSHSNVSE